MTMQDRILEVLCWVRNRIDDMPPELRHDTQAVQDTVRALALSAGITGWLLDLAVDEAARCTERELV